MNIVNFSLKEDFKKYFGITDVLEDFEGGQKKVFVVTRKGEKQVLKLFKDFGEREERELGIYKNYYTKKGLPKIIEIEEYKGDKVVFEKYIDGNTLDSIRSEYEGNSSLIKELIKNIITVITPLWENKIVHRDLKPGNIIIDQTGFPHVIDFGIARDLEAETLTETGFQPKTVLFSSPEQILGKKELISYRSDFFNLGIIAYYLYYGILPFGNKGEEILKAFQNEELSYQIGNECKLKKFLDKVFTISPVERPRTPELLKQLLPN